jgi:hypothetical protein
MEFITRAAKTSKAHALETMMGFEMSKAHLNLLPLIAGFFELRGSRERAGIIASVFVDVACSLARCRIRTALRFQWARTAIEGAGPIVPGVGFDDTLRVSWVSMTLQSVVSWTRQRIGLRIEDKIVS